MPLLGFAKLIQTPSLVNQHGKALFAGRDGKSVYIGASIEILDQSFVRFTAAANTDEQTGASFIMPGGTMKPYDALRISSWWFTTNGADDKTMRVKVDGTIIGSRLVTTNVSRNDVVIWGNRGLPNSQLGGLLNQATGGYAESTGSWQTTTKDTSLDLAITLTGQKETGADNLRLEGYIIELLRSPRSYG